MRAHIIVAYDIADPNRLRRVARTVEDFGDRVQKSVFACQLSPRDLSVLRQRLLGLIESKEDQVIFFPLGPVHDGKLDQPALEYLGKKVPPHGDARAHLLIRFILDADRSPCYEPSCRPAMADAREGKSLAVV